MTSIYSSVPQQMIFTPYNRPGYIAPVWVFYVHISLRVITLKPRVFFGPSLPILKGKTVRQSPKQVQSDYISVPASILAANQYVTLSCDISFINKIPFLVTVSDHIKFTTAEHIKTRAMSLIRDALLRVVKLY